MPHFIHHILWSSGHSNCFPLMTRKNVCLSWGCTVWPQSSKPWKLIRKLGRLYSLTQPVHVKVIQFFNFVIFPSKNTLHPPCLAKIHIQPNNTYYSCSIKTYRIIHECWYTYSPRAYVKRTSLFATVPKTICLTIIWLYCELEAAKVDLSSLKQFTTKDAPGIRSSFMRGVLYTCIVIIFSVVLLLIARGCRNCSPHVYNFTKVAVMSTDI
jgi:hypothetical protein